ncbi:MAG: Mur ligase family protein [Chloroflexi bacterium]|nr:Mur ligase family protein [Chloroflexota bacterium]
MAQNNWRGKRVVVIGAARQGIALARYLARHQAKVILNDQRPADQLKSEMDSLKGFEVEWITGGHALELLDPRPDLVCVSGGVPLNNPIVLAALNQNIQLSNDTQIFLDAVPCKTIGITGSAGKTTTTSLLGRMAQSNDDQLYAKSWIGGNIGDPLLNYVDDMQPNDLAILEISSFQSELMENYIAAKSRVIKFQSPDASAILGRDDPAAWALTDSVHGHLFSFGFSPLPKGQDGAFIEDGKFHLRAGTQFTRLPVEEKILLRGQHNRLNTLAACTIAYTAGLSPQAMLKGVTDFQGVLHRLEFVRNWQGAEWYNDSIATAPERTIAAIRAFETPIILLLGGKDKDLPWEELANLIHERVEHVIIFGAAAEKIETAIGAVATGAKPYSVTRVKKCHEAVAVAERLAQPGFVVLFSPGGTSYDEFKDFEERGERYKQWVREFSEKPVL